MSICQLFVRWKTSVWAWHFVILLRCIKGPVPYRSFTKAFTLRRDFQGFFGTLQGNAGMAGCLRAALNFGGLDASLGQGFAQVLFGVINNGAFLVRKSGAKGLVDARFYEF